MKIVKIPKLAFGLLTTAAVLFAGTGQAAVPELISYQGQLTDAEGVPVDDGDYTFDVKLGTEDASVIVFDSGDLQVPVADGLYSLEIGPVTDLLGLAENDIFLHLTIEGEAFAPVPFTSVAYALLSQWAGSVADGAITESSLSSDLATTIAAVPTLESDLGLLATDLGDVQGEIDVSGDLTIGELVNALRGVTQPEWTSKTTYVITEQVSFSSANAFSVNGPSLYDPINGGSANRPLITLNAADLPPGVDYDEATDTISSISGPDAGSAGSYEIDLVAEDFLGQEITQTIIIQVVDVSMGAITGAITNPGALNEGTLLSGDPNEVLAGDTVEISQAVVGSASDVAAVSGFPFTWSFPDSDGNEVVDGFTYVIPGAKKFTTGLPGMDNTNHEGNYQPTLVLDFGQTISGAIFAIGDIDPGFSLDDITYNGSVVGIPQTVTAGDDSEVLGVTANLFPGFNGTAMFRWYIARNDTDAANNITMIPGEVLQNYTLRDSVQFFDEDGRALQNGGPHPRNNFGEDDSYYFAGVSNGFADLATATILNSSNIAVGDPGFVELQINDNINIADDPDDKTEYDGYPGAFGVVAGTTNSIGDLSFAWSAMDVFGDSVSGDVTDNGNTFTIPGENVLLDNEPITSTVEVTSDLNGVNLASENSSAVLDVMSALQPVVLGSTVAYDVTNDLLGDPVISDVSGDAYFGIYSPNTDGAALTETVNINDDVTFQAIVYVEEALLTTNDDGEFVNFATGPDRTIDVTWFLQPDAGGSEIEIPASNVSGPSFVQVDAGNTASATDRVGVRYQMTLENVQTGAGAANNDADGKIWAVFETPTGSYSFAGAPADLTVN